MSYADSNSSTKYFPHGQSNSYQDIHNGNKASSRKSREQLNDIEKLRTRRINAEVLSLRTLLETSNIQTKKDKFSILSSAYDFVVDLKEKIKSLEEEIGSVDGLAEYSLDPKNSFIERLPDNTSNGHLNYEVLFTESAVPMALAALDGQFIQCNDALCSLSGYSRDDLLSISIFHLCPPEEMEQMYTIVGNMLTYPYQTVRHFWKRCKFRHRGENCFYVVWLILQPNGEPVNIQFMLVTMDEVAMKVTAASASASARDKMDEHRDAASSGGNVNNGNGMGMGMGMGMGNINSSYPYNMQMQQMSQHMGQSQMGPSPVQSMSSSSSSSGVPFGMAMSPRTSHPHHSVTPRYYPSNFPPQMASASSMQMQMAAAAAHGRYPSYDMESAEAVSVSSGPGGGVRGAAQPNSSRGQPNPGPNPMYAAMNMNMNMQPGLSAQLYPHMDYPPGASRMRRKADEISSDNPNANVNVNAEYYQDPNMIHSPRTFPRGPWPYMG